MPDWKKLVRERIAPSALPAASREEVVSELAAHLEETYKDARSRGLTDAAAVECALQEVSDWHLLAKEILERKRRTP